MKKVVLKYHEFNMKKYGNGEEGLKVVLRKDQGVLGLV